EASAALLVEVGVEGVEPAIEAAADVLERPGRDGGTADEQHDPEDDPARAARRDVDHHEEEPEVEQTAAEVALEHDDGHRQHPDDDDGAEVARSGEGDARDLAADDAERVARGDEVAREEHGEGDLRDLARLERRDPEVDPGLGAVDIEPD